MVSGMDVLCRGWVAVRFNNGARGIDKVNLAAVEEYWVARLLGELASELREGRYRPLPARRVLIPKPGTSEQRPLSIPRWSSLAAKTRDSITDSLATAAIAMTDDEAAIDARAVRQAFLWAVLPANKG